MDLTNQLQLGLHNEERNALITLHNKMYDFYALLTDVALGNVDFRNNDNLKEQMDLRSIRSDAFFHSKNNAMLFIDDEDGEEIENVITEIFLELNQFSEHHINYLSVLMKHNIKYKENSTNQQLNEHYERFSELQKEYLQKVFAMVDKTGPKITNASKIIKKYFQKRLR